MTRKRTIGTAAAVGGFAAAISLLSWLPSAAADELTDLRAANTQLQQRLDQLAQVGTAKPQLPPGTTSLAGSFPRSFLIPGTDTSIQIGGFIKLDATDWLQGGSPNNSNGISPGVTGAAALSGAPLDLHGTGVFAPPAFNPHSRGNGVFRMGAGDSRLFVETRTPTAWGEALTHFEIDFFGCTAGGVDCSNLNNATNPLLPRLRLAYGTLGGFMAGQNWIPVNDLAASSETFNSGGEAGTFGYARAPQVGYKTSVPWLNGASVGIYAVQPGNQLVTPVGAVEDDTFAVNNTSGCTSCAAALAVNPTKSTFPDANMTVTWQQPWGHLQLNGVLRDLEIDDGAFVSQQYIGYGGGFSGNVKPAWLGWVKDNIGFQAFAGSGLGHYATDPGSGEPTTTQDLATNFGLVGAACTATGAGCYGAATGAVNSAANGALVRAATINQWGANVNYQHWWTETIRSNASFGILHQDIPKSLVAPFGPTNTPGGGNFNYNKEWVQAMANLIWSPVPFINTGLEFQYGHRDTIWNIKGDQELLDYAFQVKF